MNADPFIPTGKKSNKIFLMALVNIAPTDNIKCLPFDMLHPTYKVRMVQGIKHNTLSMFQFAKAKYITVFDNNQVTIIYDATSTKVTVLQGSVLRGWKIKDCRGFCQWKM